MYLEVQYLHIFIILCSLRVESIPLTQWLSICVILDLSDIGIITYRYPQIDLFMLVINLASKFPGTIGLIGCSIWFFEYIWYFFNKKKSSDDEEVISRFTVARREIEEDKIKRANKHTISETNPLLINPDETLINH